MSDEPQNEPVLYVTPQDFHPGEEFAEFSKLDERQIRALQAYAKSLDVEESCKVAGIAYSTWYQWRHKYPHFKDLVERVRALAVPEVEDAHFRTAKAGNVEAQKSILKAHDPKYRDKQVIEVVSPDVQRRLAEQIDFLIGLFKRELEPAVATRLTGLAAEGLRQVWTT